MLRGWYIRVMLLTSNIVALHFQIYRVAFGKNTELFWVSSRLENGCSLGGKCVAFSEASVFLRPYDLVLPSTWFLTNK